MRPPDTRKIRSIMLNTPFPPWPSFTSQEADAVRDVILSNRVNYWTGQEGRKFEEEFAVWAETAHAIALANGPVALDLALTGLGIGPGAIGRAAGREGGCQTG